MYPEGLRNLGQKRKGQGDQTYISGGKEHCGWTAYYNKKSIYGHLFLLQQRHPFVAALDAQTVCKEHYDDCASFKNEIHLLDNALEKHEDNLKKAISDTFTGNGKVL